ncbi:MAG: hypothetical protein HMLIMOIP_001285 [Candidatus Nitrosomirales archaeon]|jgi:hypothetical protein
MVEQDLLTLLEQWRLLSTLDEVANKWMILLGNEGKTTVLHFL